MRSPLLVHLNYASIVGSTSDRLHKSTQHRTSQTHQPAIATTTPADRSHTLTNQRLASPCLWQTPLTIPSTSDYYHIQPIAITPSPKAIIWSRSLCWIVMLKLQKSYVVGEDQEPIAVQIPIEQFKQLEEILENYGLAQLMDEPAEDNDDERLNKADARAYYQQLKNQHVEG